MWKWPFGERTLACEPYDVWTFGVWTGKKFSLWGNWSNLSVLLRRKRIQKKKKKRKKKENLCQKNNDDGDYEDNNDKDDDYHIFNADYNDDENECIYREYIQLDLPILKAVTLWTTSKEKANETQNQIACPVVLVLALRVSPFLRLLCLFSLVDQKKKKKTPENVQKVGSENTP